MTSFSGSNVWGLINLIAVLLISMLTANTIKRSIKPLRNSLIPASVLGGILLLIFAEVYKAITGTYLFDTEFFGGIGSNALEILTYHALALGFISSALKPSARKTDKKRSIEIFDTGVTTVATYLIQGILGLGITVIAAYIMTGFFPAAGVLLPFGYGQGTGQALNYGTVYMEQYGFTDGNHFGLTIAALGFLSASIGGVIHLNILRKRGKIIAINDDTEKTLPADQFQAPDEIPLSGTIEKLTVQIGLVFLTYIIAYLAMLGLSKLIPSFASTLFGFNFLFGVLVAALIKLILNFLRKKKIVKKQYVNSFLMTRVSGFFFDIMVIAGIAAIKLEVLRDYWVVLIILGVVGAVATYIYNRIVAKTLFPDYREEQFLAMYGMLTGTASTGMILLREIDREYATPAADNLVYQQLPAIVFGFPMMLLATFAPKNPLATLGILVSFFAVMNLILFRKFIFRRKPKNDA